MAIILKANKVNLFVSSVLFVFWYHSPKVLDTLPKIIIYNIHIIQSDTTVYILYFWLIFNTMEMFHLKIET
jgi:hypothetical protein